MKIYSQPFFIAAIVSLLLIFNAGSANAQGTGFTYQGQLTGANGNVNGLYDFQFAVFDGQGGGNQIGNTIVTNAVGVTNGLFTVTLDFGVGVFTGNPRWLDLAAHTNNSPSPFVSMTPRQELTSAPYSVLAGNLSTSAALNVPGLTIQPNANGAPNVIEGSSLNFVSNGVIGGTISGGGAINFSGFIVSNSVTGNFGAIGGGYNNVAGPEATVAGGLDNLASGQSSAILGGALNTASGIASTAAGGAGNRASGNYSLAAGYQSQATNDSAFVWSDQELSSFNSTSNNQFLVRASGGVGINTNNPGTAALSVNGAVVATSFNGNGAVSWETVSTGSKLQAQPNHGYLVTSTQPITVSLPTAPNVGDIVRISTAGSGGWTIAQNSTQMIKAGFLSSAMSPHGPMAIWANIAGSADGTKLVAAANTVSADSNNEFIFISNDSGVTWTQVFNQPTNAVGFTVGWAGLACSADRSQILALAANDNGQTEADGEAWISRDSGTTWTPVSALFVNRSYSGAASSANGAILAISVSKQGVNGGVWISRDSGATWSQANSDIATYAIAVSPDGSNIAAVAGSEFIFSRDSGVTWTTNRSPQPTGQGTFTTSLAMSADGSKIFYDAGSQIFGTSNQGATWTMLFTGASFVACSMDALTVAADNQFSTDGGLTWTQPYGVPYGPTLSNWNGTIVSADGTKLASIRKSDSAGDDYSGQIWTAELGAASTGVSGNISGNRGSAIELQYTGNGQFMVISHEGAISAQ